MMPMRPTGRLRAASHRHSAQAASSISAADRASFDHEVPRVQSVALTDMAIIVKATGNNRTFAAVNQKPKMTTVNAAATAARSRMAPRRPSATASEPRAAITETVGGAPSGTSSAGNRNCTSGASAVEKT